VRVAVVTACLVALVLIVVAPSQAVSPTWKVVSSPSAASIHNELYGAARVPATAQIWAVGRRTPADNTTAKTLVLRWNGTAWKIVSSPSVANNNRLSAVTAISASNAWAVGVYTNLGRHPLAIHWNGTSWKTTTVPAPTTGFLSGVASTSASNVWAVGSLDAGIGQCGPGSTQLLEHWNGSAWSSASPPTVTGASSTSLSSVTPIPGTTDLIAAGSACINSSVRGLIERYHAGVWSVATAPAGSPRIASIAAVSSTNVMVVGSQPSGLPYAARWSGSVWTQSTTPNPADMENGEFFTVTPIPNTTTYWAVGIDGAARGEFTLAERWSSGAWHLVATPNPNAQQDLTVGVAAVSASEAWTVGWRGSSDGFAKTFILHYH
jgi:hypothetical protein